MADDTVQITLRLPRQHVERLDEICTMKQVSRVALVARMIERSHFSNHKADWAPLAELPPLDPPEPGPWPRRGRASDIDPGHTHYPSKVLPYGLELCGCGAVFGIDGRWRTVVTDDDHHVHIGAPEGVCRHPAARRDDGRVLCVGCGHDFGPDDSPEPRFKGWL